MIATVLPIAESPAAALTGEQRFEFGRVPGGWWAVLGLVVVIGLCYAAFWLYRREARAGVSARARVFMACLRSAVIVLLAIVWLEPVLASYMHRRIDSYTLVLVDSSASMALRDRYPQQADADRVTAFLTEAGGVVEAIGDFDSGLARTHLARALLIGADEKFLRQLGARNRVKLFTFSDDAEHRFTLGAGQSNDPIREYSASANPVREHPLPVAEQDAPEPLLPEPIGTATNISRAIRRAVESLGDTPIAAIVVLSDGGVNEGEPADTVARYAKQRRLPIFSVGIGDPTPPRNVRVVEVEAPASAFAKDPFAVTAHLSAEGMIGRTISVELIEQTAALPAAAKTVQTKHLTVTKNGRTQPVQFRCSAEKAGRVTYRVAVPPDDFETITDDNSRQATVDVHENKLRVLLVSGAASWQYRLVARLLERDATVNLSCWLQSADVAAVRDGNTIIDHLPSGPEELFGYDAILLFDPQDRGFKKQWQEQVRTLVSEHGGGLLFAAARRFTPTFMRDPQNRTIVELLPVSADAESDLILNRMGHFQPTEWKVSVPVESLGHPVLNQSDDMAENERIWSQLGGVYWHYPVKREKPLATALLRHTDPRMQNNHGEHVLLATQFVGTGRTAWLGFDSTWRWRRCGEKYFERFWVQMPRYLAEGKVLGGKKRGLLQTERDSYQMGQVIEVTARLLDANFLPVREPSITADHARPDGTIESFSLKADPDRAGWYKGRVIPRQAGGHQLRIELPAGPDTVAREILVTRPNIETARPQMNRHTLETLAEQSHDGAYFEIDQAWRIPALIADRHQELTVRGRPMVLWDKAWTLALLVALLSVEWFVRKRSRLL